MQIVSLARFGECYVWGRRTGGQGKARQARREECLPKQTSVKNTKWRSKKKRAAERAELRKAFKLRAFDDLIFFFVLIYAPYLLVFFFVAAVVVIAVAIVGSLKAGSSSNGTVVYVSSSALLTFRRCLTCSSCCFCCYYCSLLLLLLALAAGCSHCGSSWFFLHV